MATDKDAARRKVAALRAKVLAWRAEAAKKPVYDTAKALLNAAQDIETVLDEGWPQPPATSTPTAADEAVAIALSDKFMAEATRVDIEVLLNNGDVVMLEADWLKHLTAYLRRA